MRGDRTREYEDLCSVNADLLEAAKAARDEMGQYVDWHHKHDGGCSTEFEDAYLALRAAIAKAEGR